MQHAGWTSSELDRYWYFYKLKNNLKTIYSGMRWDCFTHLYKQHFKVNAGVQRDLLDTDFELLKYKLQCPDCNSGENGNRINGVQRRNSRSSNMILGLLISEIVTFKNVLCPHLRYECGSTNVRFSVNQKGRSLKGSLKFQVWRGMLELLQIFHDARNNVKKMWEMGLLLGFLEFDEVDSLLETHKSALIMRLSFVTGGLKQNANKYEILYFRNDLLHCQVDGPHSRSEGH